MKEKQYVLSEMDVHNHIMIYVKILAVTEFGHFTDSNQNWISGVLDMSLIKNITFVFINEIKNETPG